MTYKLLTFKSFGDEPSASPFCTKIMCLLTMSGVAWERKDISNPGSAPYNRLPVLELPNSNKVPDSHLIEDFLVIEEGADFYPGLSPRDRALARTMMTMAEGNLYRGLVFDRWRDQRNWTETKDTLFSEIPFPLRSLVAGLVRRKVVRSLELQGFSRMKESHRMQILDKDIRVINDLAGNHEFLFGDEPCAADAAVISVLSPLSRGRAPTKLTQRICSETKIMDYLSRGRLRLYPTVT